MANNSTLRIQEHFLECLGKEGQKSGGEHRHEYLSEEEKEMVRNQLQQMKMFREKGKEKVDYNIQVRRIWENLKDENVDLFLERNCKLYNTKKTYRFK